MSIYAILGIVGGILLLFLILFLVLRSSDKKKTRNQAREIKKLSRTEVVTSRRDRRASRAQDRMCSRKCSDIVAGYNFSRRKRKREEAKCHTACMQDADTLDSTDVSSLFDELSTQISDRWN